MFRVDDRIVCIDKSNSTGGRLNLTKGKIYIVNKLIGNKNGVYIIDDDGESIGYFYTRFISLKEYRKQKIDRLCLEKEIK